MLRCFVAKHYRICLSIDLLCCLFHIESLPSGWHLGRLPPTSRNFQQGRPMLCSCQPAVVETGEAQGGTFATASIRRGQSKRVLGAMASHPDTAHPLRTLLQGEQRDLETDRATHSALVQGSSPNVHQSTLACAVVAERMAATPLRPSSASHAAAGLHRLWDHALKGVSWKWELRAHQHQHARSRLQPLQVLLGRMGAGWWLRHLDPLPAIFARSSLVNPRKLMPESGLCFAPRLSCAFGRATAMHSSLFFAPWMAPSLWFVLAKPRSRSMLAQLGPE